MDWKRNRALVPGARNLRKNMTKEERKLWYLFLKDYPIRIYRQKVLNRFVADFYCVKAKMVIEIDGSQHYLPQEAARDKERAQILAGFGLKVLRIPNSAVNQSFSSVCAYIDQEIQAAVRQQ